MTEEFDGQGKLRRDVDTGRAMRSGDLMHVCCECGGEGTDVQLFILALNGGGRQLRGYWHPRCFKKVQHHIIVATRTSVLSSLRGD